VNPNLKFAKIGSKQIKVKYVSFKCVSKSKLIFARRTLVTMKSSILILWKSLIQKNPKALIGSQSIVEDLLGLSIQNSEDE